MDYKNMDVKKLISIPIAMGLFSQALSFSSYWVTVGMLASAFGVLLWSGVIHTSDFYTLCHRSSSMFDKKGFRDGSKSNYDQFGVSGCSAGGYAYAASMGSACSGRDHMADVASYNATH